MIKTPLIKYSLQNIYKRRRRSGLTVLSVLIGIAAVTSLISFGYGISDYVAGLSQKMGTDKLIVGAKGIGGPGAGSIVLDDTDLDAIRKVSGVEEAAGMYVISAEVEYNKQKKYAFIGGVDIKEHKQLIEELMTVKVIEGDYGGYDKSKTVLGYNYLLPDKIFTRPVNLGDKIKVNGVYLTVSGFFDAIGNPSDDANIYVTNDAAKELFGAKSYAELFVRASPGENTTKVGEDITKKLRTHRNQKKGAEDFYVQTFEQAIATFNTVLNIIIAVVLLIALISVIVASVNIMNTMYASIIERTKEIGIFKAIGARNSEILFIFIMESGLLSLIGGILGIAIGFAIAKVGGIAIAYAGYGFLKPYFTPLLVSQILLFAFLVGIIAGFLPAYSASKLSPVEALRYE